MASNGCTAGVHSLSHKSHLLSDMSIMRRDFILFLLLFRQHTEAEKNTQSAHHICTSLIERPTRLQLV